MHCTRPLLQCARSGYHRDPPHSRHLRTKRGRPRPRRTRACLPRRSERAHTPHTCANLPGRPLKRHGRISTTEVPPIAVVLAQKVQSTMVSLRSDSVATGDGRPSVARPTRPGLASGAHGCRPSILEGRYGGGGDVFRSSPMGADRPLPDGIGDRASRNCRRGGSWDRVRRCGEAVASRAAMQLHCPEPDVTRGPASWSPTRPLALLRPRAADQRP